MQFHLNGFRAGDPRIKLENNQLYQDRSHVDVLIVGCGPAGLTLATQLCQFNDIKIRIVERKSGPIKLGQADGISCRTLEMFESFGFCERVLAESYWVNETTFWGPSSINPDNIIRTGRIQDVADDLSEMPHVILNQARVHDFYLEMMHSSAQRLLPEYDKAFVGFTINPSDEYPLSIKIKQFEEIEIINAKYLVGCDGARSLVRESMENKLIGETANKAWGVMDVLALTNFPDIRFKSIIRSNQHGNILIIPREGGYLVRLYVEMETLEEGVRVKERNIQVEDLIKVAEKIFIPYSFKVKEVAWWSVYEIGQRLCDRFDNSYHMTPPNVFIAGDACHTHSPKAGQGMNVSMGDSFNLGWKIASVLRNHSPPELLSTYSDERQHVAQELIEFDKHWSKEFSERGDGEVGRNLEAFQEYFTAHGRYTAGVAVKYSQSLICGTGKYQDLALGFEVGTRFHSAPVIRLWDAKPMQLGHCLKADGRWRIILFNDASAPDESHSKIYQQCEWFQASEHSPIHQCKSWGEDIDSIIDLRAVFQQSHRQIKAEDIHPLLTPAKGRYGLLDHEKMFCVDPAFDIYERRQISREEGCLVLIRPDQYIAEIFPLTATTEVGDFLNKVLRRISAK